ncbi:hypothetical protein DASC09_046300 [Saccharomycopsis crataegensis]|uniref:Uncharacterized protein n=1 Tax=Saccharomycopsis crataegensis TaxID=43959 RepID=A0AAV5QRX0_9ASCO|nr:hypothetical protein DASC09_046300 [Saccharomycopsis crataegensis]
MLDMKTGSASPRKLHFIPISALKISGDIRASLSQLEAIMVFISEVHIQYMDKYSPFFNLSSYC